MKLDAKHKIKPADPGYFITDLQSKPTHLLAKLEILLVVKYQPMLQPVLLSSTCKFQAELCSCISPYHLKHRRVQLALIFRITGWGIKRLSECLYVLRITGGGGKKT